MSDQVKLYLIIAVAVVLVLFIFRRQLRHFFLKVGKEGLETRLDTHDRQDLSDSKPTSPVVPGTVTIRGNKQMGRDSSINVSRPNVSVEDNKQTGSRQDITVGTDKPE